MFSLGTLIKISQTNIKVFINLFLQGHEYLIKITQNQSLQNEPMS
jgi:hypothetical protein